MKQGIWGRMKIMAINLKSRGFITYGQALICIPNYLNMICEVNPENWKVSVKKSLLLKEVSNCYISFAYQDKIYFLDLNVGDLIAYNPETAFVDEYYENPCHQRYVNAFLKEETVIIFPKKMKEPIVCFDIKNNRFEVITKWDKNICSSVEDRVIYNACLSGDNIVFTITNSGCFYEWSMKERSIEKIHIFEAKELRCILPTIDGFVCSENTNGKIYFFNRASGHADVMILKEYTEIIRMILVDDELFIQGRDYFKSIAMKDKSIIDYKLDKDMCDTSGSMFMNVYSAGKCLFFLPYGAEFVLKIENHKTTKIPLLIMDEEIIRTTVEEKQVIKEGDVSLNAFIEYLTSK